MRSWKEFQYANRVPNPYDLHSHTRCSDGALNPEELLTRAAAEGIEVLSITDHDSVEAYGRLPEIEGAPLVVPGIELSTTWGSKGIHVLGLDIDPSGGVMKKACLAQGEARRARAVEIGERLAQKGLAGTYKASCLLADSERPGRMHFARHLVEAEQVNDLNQAFKRYLGDGKAGDVKSGWGTLEQVIGWIRDSGGIAVLAHPLKYRLTRTRLKRLLADFVQLGGQGMEVVSGQQQAFETADMGRLSREFGLLASCGSDFHEPDRRWAELGRFAPLPETCTPVWSAFRQA